MSLGLFFIMIANKFHFLHLLSRGLFKIKYYVLYFKSTVIVQMVQLYQILGIAVTYSLVMPHIRNKHGTVQMLIKGNIGGSTGWPYLNSLPCTLECM